MKRIHVVIVADSNNRRSRIKDETVRAKKHVFAESVNMTYGDINEKDGEVDLLIFVSISGSFAEAMNNHVNVPCKRVVFFPKGELDIPTLARVDNHGVERSEYEGQITFKKLLRLMRMIAQEHRPVVA